MFDRTLLDGILESVWQRAVDWLPALLGAILVLAVGTALAALLAASVRGFLRRTGLDDLVGSELSETLSRGGLETSPSELVGRLLFWFVVISAGAVALEGLGLTLSQLPVQSFIAYVPRAVGAVVILIAGAVLAGFAGRGADAAAAGMGIDYHRALGRTVRVVLLTLTGVATVEQLGFDATLLIQTFTNVVSIAAAGLALAFALGGREVARNALAGHYAREQFGTGVQLEVEGRQGTLEGIGAISAEIRTADGNVFVPNSRLVEGTVRVCGPADGADRA